ncbi:MAG: PNGase F N-terminal domain-containing protein [Fermentimonas sp.]|nr:PNGase F N-terminal domain-containing protein [Fermentimonas sp.]
MRKLISTTIILVAFLQLSIAQRTKEVINTKLFTDTPILFNPTDYPNGVVNKDDITYLGNGRIALKRIEIPNFTNFTKAEIKVTLVSNGDPWDKSGSCFVIPAGSGINMIDIAADRAVYPQQDTARYEQLKGIVKGNNYNPTVELMRFMTPFGVGHFSDDDDSTSAKRRPVYVDGWAKEVVWTQDITDLITILENGAYIGVFIDTWTPEGYVVDVELNFTESALNCDPRPNIHVESLINTNYYIGQRHPDIFSRQDVVIPFNIPENAKNVRLKYIATGHGGHSGGDEFHPQKNILSIDGEEILNFTPWRTDCASFRRFNPTSGVWLRKRPMAFIGRGGKREVKEIEEPLASSDLSRSNWCPGSDITPEEINLQGIKPGNHTLTISIPESTPISDNKLNHWLVSAYLVWEE